MKNWLLLFSALNAFQYGYSYLDEEPDELKCNSTNACVSIFDCTNLYNIYKKNNNATEDEKNTVQRAKCGFRGGAPYVCCTRTCGVSKWSSTRIVGGGFAELGDWPWMVALYARIRRTNAVDLRCGGSLIANQWVLTAAHCIPTRTEFATLYLDYVRLGDLDLNSEVYDGATPIERKIDRTIPHPEYHEDPYYNDIALLRLIEPVLYTDHIRPICLHSGDKYTSSERYYEVKRLRPFVAGWGVTKKGLPSSHLKVADLNIISYDLCSERYADKSIEHPVILNETMLCSAAPGKDSCQGDSGGPLMFAERGYWAQGGIVSFGVKCADKHYPGVYTKVAAFTGWISESTGLKF